MIITGKQFRYFYPQKSLNFNFKVYNYSSNNFEIGITGTNYIYFKFKDGIIKDHYENIVGTFNKDSVDIEAYIKDDKYEYYLNSVPVARDLIIANATSVFSSLVVQILDTPITNSVEISASVNGEKIPELEFSNFYSTESTNGKISNYNEYPVDIFSFSSSTLTGQWLYPSILYPNQTSDFFNYDSINIDVDTPVTLNLDTNFGQKSYTLYVKSLGSTDNPSEPEEDIIDEVKSFAASIYKYSGEIIPTGVSKAIYEVQYVLSEPNQILDLSFDYQQGKSGDATINLTEEAYVTFSGFLGLTSGVGSGILYNSDYYLEEDDFVLGFQKQTVNFYPELGTLTGYFDKLDPTGTVEITVYGDGNDTVLTKNLNDNVFTSENSYYMDLGGKTGLYPNTKPNISNQYERIVEYKDIKIDETIQYATIKGEVKEGEEGKYTFTEVTVPINSGILFNSQPYNNALTSDQNPVTIYPYRGVGFACLENQFVILSGDNNGSNRPFLIMNQSTEALFFKNIPNIDYKGQYIIYPVKTEGNLLKGRVLPEKVLGGNVNTFYYKTGLYFNTDSELSAEAFINDSIIKDGINVYRNISPFKTVEDTKSQLYVKYNLESRKLKGPEIDWNDNNFLALKKPNETKLIVFNSTNEELTLGFSVKDPLFIKDAIAKPSDNSLNLIRTEPKLELGTVSMALNSKILTRSSFGTSFLSFKVGQYIISEGQTFKIESIESSSQLTTTQQANPAISSKEFFSLDPNNLTSPNELAYSALPTPINLDGNIAVKFIKYNTPTNIVGKYNFTHRFETTQDINDYLLSFYILPISTPHPDYYLIRIFINTGQQNGLQTFIDPREAIYYPSQDGPWTKVRIQDNTLYPNGIARFVLPLTALPRGIYNIKFSFLYGEDAKNLQIPIIGEDIEFDPKGYQAAVQIGGIQIEERPTECSNMSSLTSCPISNYNIFSASTLAPPSNALTLGSVFSFFVQSLYGLKGSFNNLSPRSFEVNDIALRNKIISKCSYAVGNQNYGCFTILKTRFRPTSSNIPYEYIERYKGVYINYIDYEINPISDTNPNIFKFFTKEIFPLISLKTFNTYYGSVSNNNFPILFTDFNKLYLEGVDRAGASVMKIFEKNNVDYGESVIEIINLLGQYNSFTYEQVLINKQIYYVPISKNNSCTPIENTDLIDIVFSGHLQNSMSLNIQAGYCRHYPFDSSTNASKDKLFGYFYETENFFDVKNTDLIDSEGNSTRTFIDSQIFPNRKEDINIRPSATLNLNTPGATIRRLIKKDSLLDFQGILNQTVYLSRAFFSQVRKVSVNLTGTFLNAQKNMSDVWTVKIFNNPQLIGQPSVSNIKENNLDKITYEFLGIGVEKTGDEKSLYLEVEHKDNTILNIIESDKALITLILKENSSDTSPETETLTIL